MGHRMRSNLGGSRRAGYAQAGVAMNEREMLENAAKACFKTYDLRKQSNGGITIFVKTVMGFSIRWNPRDNSGDCADMEAELGIDVLWYPDHVHCTKHNAYIITGQYTDHNNDKQAARRYASTMVAALMGAKL